MKPRFKILDTTLRDGSYTINFQFSVADTAYLVERLEQAGFELIEIGHGVGLNASNKGHGKALHSDEEYMQAAAKVIRQAKWGMFCIPGIARLEDVDLAAQYNMGFIRVGANVTEIPSMQPFIERARKHGMYVCANFMKSYALTPKQFAEKAKLAQDYGAEVVYVVDSAGGMFPRDVKAYFAAIRELTDVPLGFHGHDNLSLAAANSLEAIELGYDIVDTSLQGMGRSAGNTVAETLVAALIKQGYDMPIDLLGILDLGHSYIAPFLTNQGREPLDTISGFADFHSSYMSIIHRVSAKYGVHPAILICEATKIDKANMNEAALEARAHELQGTAAPANTHYNFARYIGNEQQPA